MKSARVRGRVEALCIYVRAMFEHLMDTGIKMYKIGFTAGPFGTLKDMSRLGQGNVYCLNTAKVRATIGSRIQ